MSSAAAAAAQVDASTLAKNREPPTRESPIVMFGPSGTGKSTLLKRLQSEPEWSRFGFSVSHTTRKPRPGEEHGVSYHFVTRSDFESLISQGAFIEHAEFGGNLYGTSASAVQAVSDAPSSKRCILDIDAQGVKLVLGNHAYLRPLVVFVCPPSLADLGKRLNARGTETVESLEARIGMAKGEIAYAASGIANVVIVNDDLDKAYEKFRAVCLHDDPSSFTSSSPSSAPSSTGPPTSDAMPPGILDEDVSEIAKSAS